MKTEELQKILKNHKKWLDEKPEGIKAILSGANLTGSDLSGANLSGADLRSADLRRANLRRANLSGAIGILDQKSWLNNNFKKTDDGYIVYKRIGDTQYSTPNYWIIKLGEYITEIVNTNRSDMCGCGVNFGTKEWCEDNYKSADLWECLLEFEDLCDLTVPYNTDGKARCGRLKLIKKIS